MLTNVEWFTLLYRELEAGNSNSINGSFVFITAVAIKKNKRIKRCLALRLLIGQWWFAGCFADAVHLYPFAVGSRSLSGNLALIAFIFLRAEASVSLSFSS